MLTRLPASHVKPGDVVHETLDAGTPNERWRRYIVMASRSHGTDGWRLSYANAGDQVFLVDEIVQVEV